MTARILVLKARRGGIGGHFGSAPSSGTSPVGVGPHGQDDQPVSMSSVKGLLADLETSVNQTIQRCTQDVSKKFLHGLSERLSRERQHLNYLLARTPQFFTNNDRCSNCSEKYRC